jgi:hypothetical protein
VDDRPDPSGRSDLEVPRLGVGAVTWGSPSGRSRWGPAKLAYGGTPGSEEEQRAFEASLSAGVDLFDTAAMYSGGASERRLGGLADGRYVVIVTKFPPGWLSTAEALPDALDQSLARLRRSVIDLYQHHFSLASATAPGPSVAAGFAIGVGRITDPLGVRRRCRIPPHEGDAPWQPNPAARPQPPLPATSEPPRSPTSSTSRPRPCPRWAKEGKLLFLKTLGGHRRYPEAEIRQLAEGLREAKTA